MPDLAAACLQNATKCVNHFLSDREFYNEFFHFTENLSPKAPHFFALATLQNHMPFTFAPSSEWVYHEPKNRYENYINSIRHTDKQLAYFFEKLKASPFYENSIVIITGDHAFPLGERGNDRNENFAYQENFDVPIIVDHRKNLKIPHLADAEQTASHLNLAPTILDLAGISVHTDFVAGSLFSGSNTHRPVYMVQPHSGGYQALISWPFKYIHSEIFRSEEIYNLVADPMEKHPLSLKENETLIAQLRRQTSYIYSQQKLYMKDPAAEIRTSTAHK
jgi:arylsulfatase A-like enzyme